MISVLHVHAAMHAPVVAFGCYYSMHLHLPYLWKQTYSVAHTKTQLTTHTCQKKKSQLMNYNNDVCLCAAILFLQLSTKVWKLHLNPKHTCSNMFSQSQVLFSASHYLSDIKLRYMIMIKSFIYVALLVACLKCI